MSWRSRREWDNIDKTGLPKEQTVPTPLVVVISEDAATRCQLADLIHAETLGVARLCESTRAFIEQYDPEWNGCIMLDLRISAFEAIRLLKHQQAVHCRMALVYFTVENSVPVAVDGARGQYELRIYHGPEPGADLLARVREALKQHEKYCARVAERARMRTLYENTSQREREVLERLARGRTNKEIAAELHLSPRTVEIYRSRLQHKLQAGTAADLVRLWTAIAHDSEVAVSR